MNLAPLVVFVYNRPGHTKRLFDSLSLDPLFFNTELIVYSDGPRSEEDRDNVISVRNILRDLGAYRSIVAHFSEHNLGLSRSILKGVNETLSNYETAIFLEDDLVVSNQLLYFMNSALELYKSCDKVSCISGYSYPGVKNSDEFYFLKGGDCWGWGTWRRAWQKFEPCPEKLISKFNTKELINEFDRGGSYPFYQTLVDNKNKVNDSWAIRWHASCFLENTFTLYPPESYIKNMGFDGSGMHCDKLDIFDVEVSENIYNLLIKLPEEDPLVIQNLTKLYKTLKINTKSSLSSPFHKMLNILWNLVSASKRDKFY